MSQQINALLNWENTLYIQKRTQWTNIDKFSLHFDVTVSILCHQNLRTPFCTGGITKRQSKILFY